MMRGGRGGRGRGRGRGGGGGGGGPPTAYDLLRDAAEEVGLDARALSGPGAGGGGGAGGSAGGQQMNGEGTLFPPTAVYVPNAARGGELDDHDMAMIQKQRELVHRFQTSAFHLRASEGGGKGSQQQHDQVVRYSDRYRLQTHDNSGSKIEQENRALMDELIHIPESKGLEAVYVPDELVEHLVGKKRARLRRAMKAGDEEAKKRRESLKRNLLEGGDEDEEGKAAGADDEEEDEDEEDGGPLGEISEEEEADLDYARDYYAEEDDDYGGGGGSDGGGDEAVY